MFFKTDQKFRCSNGLNGVMHMELILAQAPNLKAEAIFLLTNLFGYMEDAPNTTSAAVARSVQKHNIPAPLLQELFAPITALEEDLRETIEKDPEALYPFFFVNSAQDNWLAWAYYTLEYQHVDFAHLDLSTRRRMLALTLNCSLPLLADVADESQLFTFLNGYACDSRVKWICVQAWKDPELYYRRYLSLMDTAGQVITRHLPTLQPYFDRTRDFIARELEQNRAEFIARFGLPDVPIHRVLITPTIGGFSGKGVYWDHTSEHQCIILIMGLFHPQLQDLIRQYANTCKTLAERFKVLADPKRLEILRILAAGPMYSQELGAQLSLSPATITHHMAMLLWDGYVRVEKEGVRVKYQLCRKNLMAFLEQLPAALLENPPEHR